MHQQPPHMQFRNAHRAPGQRQDRQPAIGVLDFYVHAAVVEYQQIHVHAARQCAADTTQLDRHWPEAPIERGGHDSHATFGVRQVIHGRQQPEQQHGHPDKVNQVAQFHWKSIACCILTGADAPGDNSVAEGDGWDQINGLATPAPEATLAPNLPGAAFISYASQDAALADALCAALEREGVGCWIAPRDVRPGDFYADAIVHAINACSVLVVVLSRNSVDSAHVLREVERASSKKRPVITLRIDGALLPPALEYFLSASQWIESGAEGAERLFPKLAAAVRSQMASAPKAAVEPRAANRAPPKRKLSRYLVAAAVVIALAAAYIVFQRLWRTEHVAGEQRSTASPQVVNDKSIAVLPFM